MKKTVICLMAMGFLYLAACTPVSGNADISFSDQRKKGSQLAVEMPSPQLYESDPLPEGAVEILYTSGEYELKAWITSPANDGKKHPAIVYAHGGFAFGLQDWLDIAPYIDAGYHVMVPMLRGENGNPGNFEFFFGEVDDVIAAGEYLASQPYIDSSRLFLSGHSSGGTLALLAAMLPSPYKAVASFDGAPDIRKYDKGSLSDILPIKKNQSEFDLRSASKHISDLSKPLYVYIPTEQSSLSLDNAAFVEGAKQLGKECDLIEVQGDHSSMLQGCIMHSIHIFDSWQD